MQDARAELGRWVDGKAVRSEVDLQVMDLLGPKTAEDLAPQPKTQEKKQKPAARDNVAKTGEISNM